jgi:hypothetical protein
VAYQRRKIYPRLRERLVTDGRAGARDDERAQDGQRLYQAALARAPSRYEPARVDEEQSGGGERGGEPDAEGEYEREAVADAPQRDCRKHHHERRRARQQSA